MFGLIKSGIRLVALVGMYSIAITYLLEWGPAFAEFFVVSGLPPVIITVITCTISTLNWFFTPVIVKIALVIWLALPSVKITLYFAHKVATI